MNKLKQELTQQLQAEFNSPQMQKQISQSIKNSMTATKESYQEVETMFGGNRAGNQTGKESTEELLSKLELVGQIKKNPTLKKVLNLAGKMKQIAIKKTKTKTEYTTLRNKVELGNNPERLLPSEIMLYSNPKTKQSFMKRFAEGELLQYSQQGKDRLGKGAIVCCVDVSGSMAESLYDNIKRAEWAKAVAFGLYAVAQKQKRPFHIVEFDYKIQESYEVKKDNSTTIKKLLKPQNLGGTCFHIALNQAIEIINNKKTFKKADIIFITDGYARLEPEYIKKLEIIKKQKNISIFSIQLATRKTESLKSFSDKLVFFDGSKNFEEVFTI